MITWVIFILVNNSKNLIQFFFLYSKESSARSLLGGDTFNPNFQMVNGLNDEFNKDFPNMGDDSSLTAINIQRARDMGVPGYIYFRKLAGLNFASKEDFDQIYNAVDSTIDTLSDAYSYVDDIDLFLGLLAEESNENPILGPTQACKSTFFFFYF